MNKTLYRSNRDKMISGICGGLAEYFDMDPTIIRILWVVFTFATNGAGIVAYIVGMFIIPKKPYEFQSNGGNERSDDMNNNHNNDYQDNNEYHDKGSYGQGEPDNKSSSKLVGIILIMIGAFFLFREFFVWVDFSYIWPFVIMAVGVLIIFKDRR